MARFFFQFLSFSYRHQQRRGTTLVLQCMFPIIEQKWIYVVIVLNLSEVLHLTAILLQHGVLYYSTCCKEALVHVRSKKMSAYREARSGNFLSRPTHVLGKTLIYINPCSCVNSHCRASPKLHSFKCFSFHVLWTVEMKSAKLRMHPLHQMPCYRHDLPA